MENNNDMSKEELTKLSERKKLDQNANNNHPEEKKTILARILCLVGILSLCLSLFSSFIPYLPPYLIIICPLLITSAKVLAPNDKFIDSNFKSCLTLLIIFLIFYLLCMVFCHWAIVQTGANHLW